MSRLWFGKSPLWWRQALLNGLETKVLMYCSSWTPSHDLHALKEKSGLPWASHQTRQGYPPSVFSELPRLLERTGNNNKGSITAIYTVLVAGSDMEEPIADEVRGILDGHIILNRTLAERNHWPAIDILASLSRIMSSIVTSEHQQAAQTFRKVLSAYEKQRDMITLGAYQKGSDPETDYAIQKINELETYLTPR